uniref:Uncharacterized protein n=1 Tax=Oryza sativa subsp. japonica TaxID=39947 RepID=Q6UUL0_ORYSJ|nr:hypothetical protein OSJNBa0017M13.12 [Oryza sativa Japonica Group]
MASAPLPQAAQLGYKPNVFSFWILSLQLRFDDYCKYHHGTAKGEIVTVPFAQHNSQDGRTGFCPSLKMNSIRGGIELRKIRENSREYN